jgi:hypothetical protein
VAEEKSGVDGVLMIGLQPRIPISAITATMLTVTSSIFLVFVRGGYWGCSINEAFMFATLCVVCFN